MVWDTRLICGQARDFPEKDVIFLLLRPEKGRRVKK